MQQHDHAAIGLGRLAEAMHEGQVAIDHPLVAGEGELRQDDPDVVGFVPSIGREEEFGAQRIDGLVDSEAGAVRCEFDQRAAGLADIE